MKVKITLNLTDQRETGYEHILADSVEARDRKIIYFTGDEFGIIPLFWIEAIIGITNFQKIQSINKDELAEFLTDSDFVDVILDGYDSRDYQKEAVKRWLEQEVRE